MRKSVIILSTIVTLFLGVSSNAQDIHFSQFYELSILRNPSLTGLFTDDYKVGVVYRNQWSSISRPFTTAVANVESHLPIGKDFASFGLLAYYDKAGSIDLQTLGIYPAINYNKYLEDDNNSYLSVGFTGGYLQRSFNPSKATFDNQYQNGYYSPDNPNGETLPNPKLSQWDLGAGVSFSSTVGEEDNINYIVGVAAYHITQPNSSFYKDPNIKTDTRWNASASMSVKASESFNYQVHINYMRQGNYNEAIAGGLLGWNLKNYNGDLVFGIYAGAFYRVLDAVVPVVKLKYKSYNIGMSYDMNLSSLQAASNLQGGYEITLVKTGLLNNPNLQRSRTICPHNFW
ncbi:MAG: PorP/SprF family type IX secretion system membrane protein [Flavipsychrobacter sp.]